MTIDLSKELLNIRGEPPDQALATLQRVCDLYARQSLRDTFAAAAVTVDAENAYVIADFLLAQREK
jgi:hypothetical protein